jgi:hypothetical protein
MKLIFWFAASSLVALGSCSRTEAPPPARPAEVTQAPSPTAAPSAKPTARPELRKACALVTAAEMSAILGAPVTAEGDDRSGQTKCTYSVAQGPSPYAEVQLSWGDGEAGMAGAGLAGPGVANPYAGLGDQAASAGPMLLIKRGQDLITLVLSGVDIRATAKQIYEILDKRLPRSPEQQKPISGGTELNPG